MGHDISAHKISTPVADYRRDAETETDIYKFLGIEEFNVGSSGDGKELFGQHQLEKALEMAKAAGEKHLDTAIFLQTCIDNLNEEGQILITFG